MSEPPVDPSGERRSDPQLPHGSPGGSGQPPDGVARQKRRRLGRLVQRGRIVAVPLLVLLAFVVGLWVAPGHEVSPQPAAATASEEAIVWTCSMHPQIRLPEPGACPICGMDLIPLTEGPEASPQPNQLTLSPSARKLAEIRTTPVQRGQVADELRLLGRLDYDETAVRSIASWVGGRIDRLFVSALGAKVAAGEPLAAVYSPEVYAAHQDLILARKQLGSMQQALPIARKAAESALSAARQRLRLLGIRASDLAKMEQAESPAEHITIRSPFAGTVLEQMVNQGAYVVTGTPLFRVAALGTIWVQLDAYETDLARFDEGDVVTIEVASFPGERFEGKVKFIDPLLDPETRTARVRVEVANERGRLRPGMFAEAVIHVSEADDAPAPLVVPETAVLFTGERSVVFVEMEARAPTYEARQVQVGPRAGEVYPVVRGLVEGERVVTQGAFVLDAELQIRGGASMMTQSDDLDHSSMQSSELSAAQLGELKPLLEAMLELHVALSKDDLGDAQRAFARVRTNAAEVRLKASPEALERWEYLERVIARAAARGAGAGSLDLAREAFERLSLTAIELLRRYGNPLSVPLRLARCPMASAGKGAPWIQVAKEVENPYFGAQMYRCGDILQTVAGGQRLPPAPQPSADGGTANSGHQH